MLDRYRLPLRLICALAAAYVFVAILPGARAQQLAKPTAKTPAEAVSQTPAQIELLETHIRFEADGSSRKEVHARVRINTELGTRQFARLSFDYNRAFETVEIPLARITHASGGTADIQTREAVRTGNALNIKRP